MSDREDPIPIDETSWPAASPPASFASRVVAEVARRKAARARRGRYAVAAAAVLTLAAAWALVPRATPRGEIGAEARTEAKIGDRALVVAEPGAHLTFVGDDVTQDRGDVFYRVEPGARFTVHTPHGDVAVRGTCFRVRVDARSEQGEGAMAITARDAKSSLVGALVVGATTVGVYEGKVAVSHAGQHLDLVAGEGVRASAAGLERTTANGALAAEGTTGDDGADRAAAASGDVAAVVRSYRARLDALEAQRKGLEGRLNEAEARLAKGDAAAPQKSDFDLGPEEWREMAKRGSVKYRVPCDKPDYTPSASTLNELGLAPDDAEPIRDAYARSRERLKSSIRPVCLEMLGNKELVDKLGPDKCAHLVVQLAMATDEGATGEAMADVGAIRAGDKAPPPQGAKVHPVTRVFLALTGEPAAFEADLAKSFGPEEAHRIVWSDGLCLSKSSWGGVRSDKR